MKKTLAAIAVSILLSACGGGDNSDKPTSSPSTKIGILTDGPVGGATYIINGVEKSTNEQGEFEYKDGDQITFKIGQVTLGTVLGNGRITPSNLTNDPTAQTNILIFLQSLDRNGDHSDGIQLDSTVIQKLTSSEIDFSENTNTFIEQFQPTLARVTGKTDAVVVDSETALSNYQSALLKDIAGVWYVKAGSGADDSEIALVIKDDGSYTLGEAVVNEPDSEGNGVEVGVIDFSDILKGEFTVTTTVDTSDWGLHDSENELTMVLKYDGTHLRIQEKDNDDEGATFDRVTNNTTGITGVWQLEGGGPIFFFNTNNTYFMLDSIGDTSVNTCGGPGIEFGEYQYTNNVLKATKVKIDTNGCAGLADENNLGSFSINLQGNTIIATPSGEESVTLIRVASEPNK